MRILAAFLMLSFMLHGGYAPPVAVAADLRTGPVYDCIPPKPSYFGVYEPWSRPDESPPRKGMWYYTHPQPPAVNFLVPMHGRLCLRPKPWTPEWFSYCEQRWPSFNPRTGTIRTPDGVRMCL